MSQLKWQFHLRRKLTAELVVEQSLEISAVFYNALSVLEDKTNRTLVP